jgi:hypothetical protein
LDWRASVRLHLAKSFLSCFATLAAAWAFVTFEQITVSPIANELFNSIWQQSAAVTGQNLEQSISVARCDKLDFVAL